MADTLQTGIGHRNLGIRAPTPTYWVNKKWVKTLGRNRKASGVTKRKVDPGTLLVLSLPHLLMSIVPLTIQNLIADVPLPMVVVSSSARSSSSTPLDVTSLYAAFDADTVDDDHVDNSLAIVARDVSMAVVIEVYVSEDVAYGYDELVNVADVIAPSNTTTRVSSATTDASCQIL
ncbi:hypothetical protein GUJ93_ZPchr0002g24862 [Zizania palustris]|uniref:Uncharacterized protein n=1 Tax=Zizania palustris TaxID=103762 RepID=A0A8J5RV55_ZIZPA|nr:hypothetical protein GUJ93_ZPchr0002g24862 [Zizania palustris]